MTAPVDSGLPPLCNRCARPRARRPRTALVIRHEATVPNPESPGPIRLNRNADPWPNHDHLRFFRRRLERDGAAAKKVTALVLSVQPKCLAEPSGTAGKIAVAYPSPSRSCDIHAFDYFTRTHQNSGADSFGTATDVPGPVHAVGEVEVQVASRAEHHSIPSGSAAIGVRCRISRAVVRFELGEPDRHRSVR